MKLQQATFTSSLLALLSLFSSTFAEAPADNTFWRPAPKGAASVDYKQNSKLNVTFNNKLDDPYISLFCSYIQDPIVIERVAKGETYHPLTLDYGPQKSCYISIQKGNGPPPPENSTDAFVSALFGITPSADPYAPQDGPGGSTDAQSGECSCACEAQCESICTTLGFSKPA